MKPLSVKDFVVWATLIEPGMITSQQIRRAPIKVWISRFGLLLLLSIGTGLYAIYTQAMGDFRLAVLLVALPLGMGLFVLPNAPRVLMTLLVFSLSFSARFRLASGGQFYAGAEAAIAPLDLPFLGLLLIWFADTCISGRELRLKPGRVAKPFSVLVGVYLLSLAPAQNRALTMLEVVRLLKMGLLVLVIRHYVRNRQDVVYVVNIVLICVILQGGLAILQTVFHSNLGLGFLGERDTLWRLSRASFNVSRAGGTMGHANALANFLETLLPLALVCIIGRVRGSLRVFALVAFPVGMVGLFLTFSRAGWGASLIGMGAVLLMTGAFRIVRRSRLVFAVLLILLGLGIVAFLLWGVISQRVSVFGSSSWLVRTGSFKVASNMIEQKPWLGVGANNYLAVAHQYVPFGVSGVFADLIAHNLFYLVTAETGIVGLLVFLMLLWEIMAAGQRVAGAYDQPLSFMAIGILGGIVALVAHGMFDWLFRYDPIYTLFWFQVGLLIAMQNVLSRDDKAAVPIERVEANGGQVMAAELTFEK
jgi:hypothetical protein